MPSSLSTETHFSLYEWTIFLQVSTIFSTPTLVTFAACQPKLLFCLQFYWQALCIPTGTEDNSFFLQSAKSIPEIFDNSAPKVTCVWLAIHCRRTFNIADDLFAYQLCLQQRG